MVHRGAVDRWLHERRCHCCCECQRGSSAAKRQVASGQKLKAHLKRLKVQWSAGSCAGGDFKANKVVSVLKMF